MREQCAWVVEKHGDFQLLFYGEHVGANAHKRDAYRDSPYFDDCAEFCEKWDQSSFDPDYPTKPLEFFAPMVREVFTGRKLTMRLLSERANGWRCLTMQSRLSASRRHDFYAEVFHRDNSKEVVEERARFEAKDATAARYMMEEWLAARGGVLHRPTSVRLLLGKDAIYARVLGQ